MQLNVTVGFGPLERNVFERAATHLRIAYPDMDEELPRHQPDRENHDTTRARTVLRIVRREHLNVQQLRFAVEVLTKLGQVCRTQANPEYWAQGFAPLATTPSGGGLSIVADPQQMAAMTAETRAWQAREADAALTLAARALSLALEAESVVASSDSQDTDDE